MLTLGGTTLPKYLSSMMNLDSQCHLIRKNIHLLSHVILYDTVVHHANSCVIARGTWFVYT